MHKINVSLSLFLLLIYTQKLNAQCNIQLSGKCFDMLHKEYLNDYSVYIAEDQVLQKTDSNGIFLFKNLCAGKKNIIVQSATGHQLRFSIVLLNDTNIEVDMHDESKILETIEILDHAQTKLMSSSQTLLSSKDLFKNSGGSFSDLLQNVAGVNFIKTGSTISKPVIRGLHSNRILILNNGIRQEGQNWGSEHAPEIDSYLASEITVIKGPASVRYGNEALAGVIVMDVPHLPDSAGISGELNSAFFSNGRGGAISGIIQQEIKNTRFSYRLQGTLRRFGNIHTPDYILSNTSLSEKNFSLNVGYKLKHWSFNFFTSRFNSTIGIFSASHVGNLTDLQNAFAGNLYLDTSSFSYSIKRPNQFVVHQLYKISSDYVSNSMGKVNITYALQQNNRNEYDRTPPRNDSIAALNRPELAFNLYTHTVDAVWEHNRLGSLRGSGGINFLNQYNIYAGRNLVPNFMSNSLGFFVIEHLPIKKIELEFALRYDLKTLNVFERNRYNEIVNSNFTFKRPTFSLGFIYPITEQLKWNANISSGWRAPSVYEMFTDGVHQARATYIVGNRNLNSEINLSATTDISFKPFAFSVFTLGLFSQKLNNFIYLLPSDSPVLTIQGAFPSFRYIQENVLMNGFDFNADFDITKRVTVNIAASVVRAKTDNHEWVYGIPSDRVNSKLSYKPFGKKWSNLVLSLSGLYVFKQIRIPANIDFAPPPNAYGLLNFEVSRTIGRLSVFAGVQNLTNKKYRDFMNAFRYFADEQGRNFFLKLNYNF